MRLFTPKPGTKSAVHHVKTPFPDIIAFDAIIRSLVLNNPLGCTSYMSAKKNHPPVEKVREMYTAKFTYLNPDGKLIGRGLDMYDSVEGYEEGISAVISNLANREAHRGKVRHTRETDHFSVLLKCHDANGELYFLSMARDRVTVSSYTDDAIRKRVEAWTDSVPALA
ncbi:MAG: hypothetical protein M0Q92_01165 [Methanoregula sp.]|jgi:hypothetical protein|nr:hypothetical protein [Methanoregula sp.]